MHLIPERESPVRSQTSAWVSINIMALSGIEHPVWIDLGFPFDVERTDDVA